MYVHNTFRINKIINVRRVSHHEKYKLLFFEMYVWREFKNTFV